MRVSNDVGLPSAFYVATVLLQAAPWRKGALDHSVKLSRNSSPPSIARSTGVFVVDPSAHMPMHGDSCAVRTHALAV